MSTLPSKYKDFSSEFSKYRCIFVDSITVASRLCLLWAKMQPEAFSERSGKQDMRAAYGLLAQEMMALAQSISTYQRQRHRHSWHFRSISR